MLVQPRQIPQLVNPSLSFPLQTTEHGHGDGAGINGGWGQMTLEYAYYQFGPEQLSTMTPDLCAK